MSPEPPSWSLFWLAPVSAPISEAAALAGAARKLGDIMLAAVCRRLDAPPAAEGDNDELDDDDDENKPLARDGGLVPVAALAMFAAAFWMAEAAAELEPEPNMPGLNRGRSVVEVGPRRLWKACRAKLFD